MGLMPKADRSGRVRRRSALRLGVAAACIAVAAGGLWWGVRDAWQRCVYRDAYLPELEAASRRHSSDGRLLALIGARYAQAAEYDKAADALERAAGAGVTTPDLWLTWAACEAAADRVPKAEQVLRYAVGSGKCVPTGPVRDALGRLSVLRDSTPGAPPSGSRAAQAISPGGPGSTADRFAQGNMLNPLADWAASRRPERSGFEYRRNESERRPDDPLVQARWVDALRRNRRLRDAEAAAEKALTRWPDLPELHHAFGDVLFDGGLISSAGVRYKKALRLRPDWPPALSGLGKVALEVQLYRLAVQTFEKLTRLEPRNTDAWIGLGRAYLKETHRFDKSDAAFRMAASLDPRRTDFYVFWSDTLAASDKAQEAESKLRQRLDAAPDDARARYLLAKLLLDNAATPGRQAEAEANLRRSLEIEPNVPAVKVLLARVLLDKEGPDPAADAGILLAEALESDPRNPLALRLAAQAYDRIGQHDRAKEVRLQSVKAAEYVNKANTLEDRERQNPRDVQVHRQLAALYASAGELEKAKRQEEMVFMLTRYPTQAARGLTRLMEGVSYVNPATPEEVARGRKAEVGATGSVSPR